MDMDSTLIINEVSIHREVSACTSPAHRLHLICALGAIPVA